MKVKKLLEYEEKLKSSPKVVVTFGKWESCGIFIQIPVLYVVTEILTFQKLFAQGSSERQNTYKDCPDV